MRATWQEDSLQALTSFDPRFLWAACGLLVVAWAFDALRLHAMARAVGYRIGAATALQTNFLGYFLSAITPFTLGGGALQVYSLTRAGLPVGHGTAIVLVNGFSAQIGLSLAGIAVMFGTDLSISADPRIQQLLQVGVILYAVVAIALALMVWHVERARRFVQAIVRGVLRIVTNGGRVRSAAAAVDNFIVELNQGMQTIVQRQWGWAIVAGGAYALHFTAQAAVVPVLAMGAGVSVPFGALLLIQVPIYLLASILPTPGGSGGLEFGLAGALITFVPAAQIGVTVAGWRLLTFYLVVAIGGLVALAFVRTTLNGARNGAPTNGTSTNGTGDETTPSEGIPPAVSPADEKHDNTTAEPVQADEEAASHEAKPAAATVPRPRPTRVTLN